MAKYNSPTTKKSVESLFIGLRNVQSLGRETPLRKALYNFCIIGALGCVVTVGIVFGPFLKPLLWAYLFGAVLFPLKRGISDSLKQWFVRLEADNNSFLYEVIIIPFRAFKNMGEYCGQWLMQHIKILLAGLAVAVILKGLILVKAQGIFCFAWRLIYWSHSTFTTAVGQLNWLILLSIVIVYVTTVKFFWRTEKLFTFAIFGQLLWLIIIAYSCSFLGALQVPVFSILMMYAIAGLIYQLKAKIKPDETSTLKERILSVVRHRRSSLVVESEHARSNLNVEHTSSPTSIPNEETGKNDKDDEEESLGSSTYFTILFYACGATILYKNLWLLALLSVPIMYYIFSLGCEYISVLCCIKENITMYSNKLRAWVVERYSALLPICFPGVIEINKTLNLGIRNYLKSSIDLVSSITVIVMLILGVLFASIFLCVQIYSETFAVVELGSDLVNRTLTARPDLVQMLPEGFQYSMESMLDNAHEHGRHYIKTYIDQLFKDADKEHAKKLKHQILLVWDRLIQNWLDKSDGMGPNVPAHAITDSIHDIRANPELMSTAKQGFIQWAKSNVGMIMEVVDSLWFIIRKNMHLFGSVLWTIISVLLGGGHAVISFIVNAVIFFTGVFYLLSNSEDRYAGLAAVDALGFSLGTKIAEALESSISCVIMATALFHGLFTWLTHTWFGAHVVFLPAALATILAAAPFLGTYWCSLPAFLDLWLSQDRFYMGFFLFLIHFIIPSSVDSAIIAEIKGGAHPYLTGLSIAGGMYWLGAEGAILGPLFLCLLMVILQLTSNSIKESPSFALNQDSPSIGINKAPPSHAIKSQEDESDKSL